MVSLDIIKARLANLCVADNTGKSMISKDALAEALELDDNNAKLLLVKGVKAVFIGDDPTKSCVKVKNSFGGKRDADGDPLNYRVFGLRLKTVWELAKEVKRLFVCGTNKEFKDGVLPAFGKNEELQVKNSAIGSLRLVHSKIMFSAFLVMKLTRPGDRFAFGALNGLLDDDRLKLRHVVKVGHAASHWDEGDVCAMAPGNVGQERDMVLVDNGHVGKHYGTEFVAEEEIQASYEIARGNYGIRRQPLTTGNKRINMAAETRTTYEWEAGGLMEACVHHGLTGLNGSFWAIHGINDNLNQANLRKEHVDVVDANLADFIEKFVAVIETRE